MTEWIWVGVTVVLIFVLVYALTKDEAVIEGGGVKDPPKPTQASDYTAPTIASKGGMIAATPVSTKSKKDPELARFDYEEDAEVDPTKVGMREGARPWMSPPTQKIVYDDDAAIDEPTHTGALILVTAVAQTDRGLRRKRNEDSVLAIDAEGLFVVADGMGGHKGGEIASTTAVKTIDDAFTNKAFSGQPHDSIPARASELARAIQMANDAILAKAEVQKELEGMGTTICAARFSPNKQRLYVGHVGDSRMYRLRGDKFRQMTSDHTMRDLGVTGPGADHLSRAVGVWPTVPIDIILGKPHAGDLYLLCSDGLTKMVSDDRIRDALATNESPAKMVESLVHAANAGGGKDNVTVIVIRVDDPAKPGVS